MMFSPTARRSTFTGDIGQRVLHFDPKTTDTAMRWALVKFTVDLKMQDDEDRANASPENGWRMSDASGMFTEVINLLTALARGEIDAEEYLEAERQKSLERS